MPELPEDPHKLPLRRAWPFLSVHELEREANAIQASNDRVGSRSNTALRRGKVIDLLKQHGLLDTFIDECWPNGATKDGRALIKGALVLYERFLQGEGGPSGDPEDDEADDTTDREFAYESDLRDYLANNLHLIEEGLKLWPTNDDESAVEYRVDEKGRRIDILAQDRDSAPVVIELKVSTGHERTVGQALYCRGRVKQLMKCDRVRVVLVAREISPELRVATQDVPDLHLFEYELSMTVSEVE